METGARILVVDDEPAVLKLVRTLLSRAHYDIVIAESGAKALELIETEHFDAVITDAVMPGINGYDVVQAVRMTPPIAEMPVIMLTRKRHPEDVRKAVAAGVSDYVLKPIDEYLLLDKVNLCLKKGVGKKSFPELGIQGPLSQAHMLVEIMVMSVSESGITLRLPAPITAQTNFSLTSKVFEEIGIDQPFLHLVSCVKLPEEQEIGEFLFEARFSFIGIEEADLKKIRSWIQREMIRRRK
jgi:CheY-like chemotaxis protein